MLVCLNVKIILLALLVKLSYNNNKQSKLNAFDKTYDS